MLQASEALGQKKFADVGLVAGTELLIEAHAPFGGLIRVKVMETSMALHRDDAANIVIQPEDEAK
jgi:Fe2+ transport system protein FeoA